MSQLAELGRQVEEFYRDPRDIEWAYAGGRFYLLQARPITVAGAAEREAGPTTGDRGLENQGRPEGNRLGALQPQRSATASPRQ